MSGESGLGNPSDTEVAPKQEEKGKLLKVDSAVHFQTEPNSSRIYGSGYFNIETTDLQGPAWLSRVKESDVILYKVQTTAPSLFCIRPTIGVRKSRQYISVHVRPILSALPEQDMAAHLEKVKLQVVAKVIPPDHKFLTKEAGDGGDRQIQMLEDTDSVDRDTLYDLWKELECHASYTERHKVIVQVHPAESSSPAKPSNQQRLRPHQTSVLQRIGTMMGAILLVWVGLKLMPPTWLQSLCSVIQEDPLKPASRDLKLGAPST